jgi:LysR family transcriptional regulator, regulator for metE and metH
MEIRHLKLIKAVAETKSLTKAANKLFLTQSALSHQVKELEDEYSTRFFLRINKQMLLTPAGERLLVTANSILQEIEKNNDDIKRMSGNDVGIIRISTQCYTGYHWLSSFLRKYHSKYPDVEIRIVTEATRKTAEFLEEGKLDVAIMNAYDDNPHFTLKSLFDDEMVAIFPADHPWAGKKFVTAEDFIYETFLMYSSSPRESQTYKAIFDASGVSPRKILNIELTEAIIEMAKAGLGVAVLSKWAIEPFLKSKDLLYLPIGELGYKRTWYAATLNAAELPAYLKDFIDSLVKETKKELAVKQAK